MSERAAMKTPVNLESMTQGQDSMETVKTEQGYRASLLRIPPGRWEIDH